MKEKTEFNKKTKFKKLVKTFVLSKMFIIVLLLLIQFAFYFALFYAFRESSMYFGWINLTLSVIFYIYISNQESRNEFKLTWMFPMLIFPIFGIFLYILLKVNYGGIILQKNLKKIKNITNDFFTDDYFQEIQKNYSEFSDISKYLSVCGKNPSYLNTKFQYIPIGQLAFHDIINELKKAEKFIFIEYFIIESSQIWDEILLILKDKAKKGVEIRILYDSLGSLDYSSPSYEKYLSKFGIKAKIFMQFKPIINTGLNNRDHRKILVIDGKVCYTGGINISDEYANLAFPRFDYWKDNAIRIEGKAIKSFSLMFLQNWHLSNKNLNKSVILEDIKKYVQLDYENYNSTGIAIPYCDDAYNDEDIAENVYEYILDHSKNYVHIMTPYTVLDNSIIDSLCFAAKRGVDVSIIVPKHYDHFVTFCVGRIFIKTLIKSGVKVFEYTKGFIHSKVFVSDQKIATVGSVNLDYRSFYHHFECGIMICQNDELLKIEEDFKETLKDCSEFTMQSYKKLSLFKKLIGHCARIISPLL